MRVVGVRRSSVEAQRVVIVLRYLLGALLLSYAVSYLIFTLAWFFPSVPFWIAFLLSTTCNVAIGAGMWSRASQKKRIEADAGVGS